MRSYRGSGYNLKLLSSKIGAFGKAGWKSQLFYSGEINCSVW